MEAAIGVPAEIELLEPEARYHGTLCLAGPHEFAKRRTGFCPGNLARPLFQQIISSEQTGRKLPPNPSARCFEVSTRATFGCPGSGQVVFGKASLSESQSFVILEPWPRKKEEKMWSWMVKVCEGHSEHGVGGAHGHGRQHQQKE